MKTKMMKRLSSLFMIAAIVFTTLTFAAEVPVYGIASEIEIYNIKTTKSSISFSWKCNVPGATTVKVARNPNNKMLVKGKKISGSASGSVTDNNLDSGIECQYRVAVYNKAGKRLAYVDKNITTDGLSAVTGFKAYPGYKSITLRWNNVKGATSYEIVRWDASTNKKAKFTVNASKGSYTAYRDRSREDNVNYAYSIWAVNGKDKSSRRATTPNVKSVRQMYQKIWLKSSATLSSHGGANRTRTFGSGTAITATGFGGGKYKFWYGGSLYYCGVARVRKAVADYIKIKDQGYPNVTANNFANELTKLGIVNKSKKSNYFIWVSTYTQHLYIFKWDAKKKAWNLYNHWECATGKASSPTIINKQMRIQFKARSDVGISWWNCFSGWNGIHGKRSSYVIDGAPHSNGCVRNYNYRAKWIYDNCPVGTPVCIY